MEYCLANVFGSIRVTHSLYLLTTFDVQLKIFKENETTRLKTSYVYAVVCSEIENRFFFSAQPPCIVWKSVFFFGNLCLYGSLYYKRAKFLYVAVGWICIYIRMTACSIIINIRYR